MEEDKKWSGQWCVYSDDIQNTPKVHGTLSIIEDGHLELELICTPNEKSLPCVFNKHYTIWGVDKYGVFITIFFATPSFSTGSRIEKLQSNYALIGAHLESINSLFFNEARVFYPHLKDIFLKERLDASFAGNIVSISTKDDNERELYSIDIDENTKWKLISYSTFRVTSKLLDAHFSQDTYFSINCSDEKSLDYFYRQINEFTSFLSLACNKKQSPAEIVFYRLKDEQKYSLIFRTEKSIKSNCILFSDNLENDQFAKIIKRWHQQYDDIIPIYRYVERSKDIHKSLGDIPEFLLVEFALEGYFKRFHNKVKTENGKDIQKAQEVLETLLNYYSSVELVSKMNLDPKSIIDTRNTYTHLIPETEKSKLSVIELPRDIWNATEKLRILLLCCFLDTIGFSIEEINKMLQDAPIFLPEMYDFDTPWINGDN